MQQQSRIAIDVHSIFYSQGQNDEQQQEIAIQDSVECEEEIDVNDLEDTKDLSTAHKVGNKEFIKRQNKVSAETQLQNLSRLIKAKQSNIKKLEIVDSNKITTKLYQHKATVCSKGCKKHEQPEPKQKQERASKERQLSARGVHDRLYNMSKSQLLKEKYIPSLPEKSEPQRCLSASKSSKYLRNYVPFEKRLEEHLSLGQLANSYKKVNQDQFKPRLIPNKYSQIIQARYNKHEIRQLRPSDIAEFLNSSVSSSLSSQSRSAAIINRIQEHFVAKVKLIFVENAEEVTQVNEETIGLLTEVEFDILQPFIMEIQEKGIKGCDFQSKFREFYESLRLGDRLQLRNHETKTRGKYRQMRQEARQKLKSPKKIESKPTKPFKKETAKGDYHLAIQQFI